MLAPRDVVLSRIATHNSNFASVFGPEGYVFFGGVATILREGEGSRSSIARLQRREIDDIDVALAHKPTREQRAQLRKLDYRASRYYEDGAAYIHPDSYFGLPSPLTSVGSGKLFVDFEWNDGLSLPIEQMFEGARRSRLPSAHPLKSALVIDSTTFIVMKAITAQTRALPKDIQDIERFLRINYDGNPHLFVSQEHQRIRELLGTGTDKFERLFTAVLDYMHPASPRSSLPSPSF